MYPYCVQGVRLASHVPWPKKVLGLYILLADDDEVHTGLPSRVEFIRFDPDPTFKETGYRSNFF